MQRFGLAARGRCTGSVYSVFLPLCSIYLQAGSHYFRNPSRHPLRKTVRFLSRNCLSCSCVLWCKSDRVCREGGLFLGSCFIKGWLYQNYGVDTLMPDSLSIGIDTFLNYRDVSADKKNMPFVYILSVLSD